MIRCLDIHTHHPAPQPSGVIAATIDTFQPVDGQLYSIGIHPWDTAKDYSPEDWKEFERIAALPCVVAIGECGIDKVKGGFMYRQVKVFTKQIEISEKLEKPLIIHNVKAQQSIIDMKRELKPLQKWLVHGCRWKPTIAKMFIDAGMFLSFGERFNPETLTMVPKDYLLAETDASPLSIEEIITNMADTLYGDNPDRLKITTELIESNTRFFLSKDN